MKRIQRKVFSIYNVYISEIKGIKILGELE